MDTAYCQQVITICNYNQTSTDPTGITGSQITMGGTNCNAVVQNEQNLHLIATDYIELLPGFIADAGSNFSAKIVNCPVPQIQFALDSSEAAASTLHILSEVEQDSLSNSSERREAESVENNPPILYTKIYPNPTDGKISIEFVGYTDKIIAIELINSLGEKVYSKENIKDKKLDIDISPLPKGVYFLKGIFGSDSITDKIILN